MSHLVVLVLGFLFSLALFAENSPGAGKEGCPEHQLKEREQTLTKDRAAVELASQSLQSQKNKYSNDVSLGAFPYQLSAQSASIKKAEETLLKAQMKLNEDVQTFSSRPIVCGGKAKPVPHKVDKAQSSKGPTKSN